MSYIINKTDGSVLTEVVDGTIDQSATDLTLIGKNSSSYGESFNENFVHLLENFASSSQPNNPITGQLWFDTTDSRLKVYDGNGFKVSGGTIVQSTVPSSPVDGDLWVDTSRNLLFFRNSGIWVEASRQYTSNQGTSGFNITTVLDTLNKSHVVVLMYVAEVIIGVFSKDTFELLNPLPGYTNTTLYAGFNIGTTPGLIFNAPVTVATYLDDGLGNLKGTDSFLSVDADNTAAGTQTIENDIPLILGPGQNNEFRVDDSRFDIVANNSNQSYHFHVKHNSALKGMTIWNPGLFTLNVTTATGDGSYATLSFAPQGVEPFAVGAVVVVAGMTPTGYNGTYTVTSADVDSITYACPETGALSVAGIISTNMEPRVGILTDSPQATLEVNGNTIVQGNLTVFGTTTSINSTVVKIDDKNIELASTDSPTDILANGAGITVKGDTDKTFQWNYSINPGSTHWNSSESINIASGKTYKINDIDVLTANTLGANIVNSSLTSTGHLTALDVANFNIASNTISATSGNLILAPTGSATVDVSNKRITSVASPGLGTDATNKSYVTTYVNSRPLGMVISLNNASGGTLSDPQVVTLIQEVYPAGDYEPGTVCRVHCELTTVTYSSIGFTISDTGSPNISISRVAVDKNTTSFVSGSNVSVVQDVVAANAINAGDGAVKVTRTIRRYVVNNSLIWELQPGFPAASSV
jgi:hypothetical protein